MGKLDERGREILNTEPLKIPTRLRRPATIQEQIQSAIRNQVSLDAMKKGHESFEDAEDFDVPEDEIISTPYEMDFDPVAARQQWQSIKNGEYNNPDDVLPGQLPLTENKKFVEEVPAKEPENKDTD
jgi:hypothetical protein